MIIVVGAYYLSIWVLGPAGIFRMRSMGRKAPFGKGRVFQSLRLPSAPSANWRQVAGIFARALAGSEPETSRADPEFLKD